MTEIATVAQFEAQLAASPGLVVVNFWADWAAACQQMSAVAGALRAKYPQVTFLNVEAEKVFELSEAHAVESVPTFVLLQAGKEVGRITGADVPGLTSKVETLAGAPAGTGGAAAAAATPAEDLDTKLKRLVAQHDVMLFMKGNPDEPRCGFSRKAVAALQDAGIEFGTFDILSDEEVRQGLKTFSNWPTYPQLYGKGKLVGGLDIMQELAEGGELADALGVAPTEDLDTKLKRLVAQHDVMLFMKGNPDEPRCGFSRKAVAALQDAGIEFGTFDILSDEEVRQGLKTFSNWPTYPQLYGKGKLVGGLDIMQELAEGGELADALGVAPTEDLDTKLKRLVAQHDVMLFMKGNPDEPRCGFSRKAVATLQDAGIEFGTFDILSDEEVRQGLKTFSNWPTYPQLYSKGKLVGGLDIMQELAEGGELADSLQG